MEDMSDLMSKVNDMLKNDSMPNELKDLVKNLSNSNNSEKESNSDDVSSENTSGDFNIDMATLLKLKSAMDSMNSKQDDPKSNLLLSLKPYLSNKKKGKVDQYVKFFNMSKLVNVFNLFGGDNK